MFSECTIHYAEPTRSMSAFNVMFVTGMSTAATSQLFFSQCRASTFDITFATEVSTAAVLQLFSMLSTSMSSVYVSLS